MQLLARSLQGFRSKTQIPQTNSPKSRCESKSSDQTLIPSPPTAGSLRAAKEGNIKLQMSEKSQSSQNHADMCTRLVLSAFKGKRKKYLERWKQHNCNLNTGFIKYFSLTAFVLSNPNESQDYTCSGQFMLF